MAFEKEFKEYLESVRISNSHQAKMIAFTNFLMNVFGTSSYEVLPNVEKYISSNASMVKLKGRMDLHFGSTIIEFKMDLSRELDKAKEELVRYSKILRSSVEKVGEGIITDGFVFKVMKVGEEAKEVKEIDFREIGSDAAVLFLDTYLFSWRKVPTAEDLNMRFGPGSLVYENVIDGLSALFKSMKEPIKFELWKRNMELVYGSSPPDDSFVSQSYLMMLVRLLLARHLSGRQPSLLESVNGKLFETQGLQIIEEDFFSWIFEPEIWPKAELLLRQISDALDYYDLSQVDEDIFKEIYQEIVERGDRHRLGEYYTPEWLALLTLEEALKVLNIEGVFSALDPACGSGTFLTNIIHELKRRGATLKEILDNVCGIDLNPVAVAISRANYLLALGDLLRERTTPIFVPVYVADAIRPAVLRREVMYSRDVFVIDIPLGLQEAPKHVGRRGRRSTDQAPKYKKLILPKEIALDEPTLKKLLKDLSEILEEYRARRIDKNGAIRAFESRSSYPEDILDILKETMDTLMELIDARKDSVWLFMMRNIYAPVRMKERLFDLVIGNPPWIAFRYIENSAYQAFVKRTVFEYGLLKSDEVDLFTHMEVATLFYARSADFYLKNGGVLAFVMPRSVLTGAKQHAEFKKQRKPPMEIKKVIDVGGVTPLFNVPTCSIISKKGGETRYPVDSLLVEGKLEGKNLRLEKAKESLRFKTEKYSSPMIFDKRSAYYTKVLQGASIVPRSFWFIEFERSEFGYDLEAPLVKSKIMPDAKDPWKNISLKGNIEKEFIYATATGNDVLPFRVNFQAIVLPIEKGLLKYKILDSNALRNNGKFKMASWLDKVNEEWKKNATKTALSQFPTSMDRVNYHKLLELQELSFRYYVIYTGSGTCLAAAVVDTKGLPPFILNGVRIAPEGFIADTKTYWFGTNNLEEANYLTAILNSNVLNDLIKPIQTKGAFGARDIHRRPFEFNIPEYDPKNHIHKELAKLGAEAAEIAKNLKPTSRSKFKKMIPQMAKIDELVKQLLKIQ